MRKPRVVPVVLGCCHEATRCRLCAPPPALPSGPLVRALIDSYREDDELLRVGFYGGPPPTDEQLAAADGLPFVARIRPDLLTRDGARRLKDAGAVGIELDALTFDDDAVRQVGRHHRARVVHQQIEGIVALGMMPGIVLAPGLPGTSHHLAVKDAEIAAASVRFARIHPVLVLAGSGLQEAHLDGSYVPLELGQAVTTCRAMVDVLEPAGVEVIRVGSNPDKDGFGRAVAGPRHPSLRQLVDARRILEVLDRRLNGARPGGIVHIRCHPADETCTRGPFNQHIRTLRAAHRLAELRIHPDPALSRGELIIHEVEP